MRKTSKCVCFLLLLFVSSGKCFSQLKTHIRVIEAAAIPYMEFLSKADFDRRFSGQIKDSLAKLESGWYVIYIHENLNYYFGPILFESTGKDYLAQLNRIVKAAVEQRPTIRNYQLKLSFEPSIKDSESLDDSIKPDDGSGTENGQYPSEEPTRPKGFWSFIRRIFNF